jgi:Mad3/BUB1 homology region 1
MASRPVIDLRGVDTAKENIRPSRRGYKNAKGLSVLADSSRSSSSGAEAAGDAGHFAAVEGKREWEARVATARDSDSADEQTPEELGGSGFHLFDAWHGYLEWADAEPTLPLKQLRTLYSRATCDLAQDRDLMAGLADNQQFLRAWLCFVNTHDNPDVVLRFMDAHQIGRRSGAFYLRWAAECGDPVASIAKVQLGIEREAQPIDLLHRLLDELRRTQDAGASDLEAAAAAADAHALAEFAASVPRRTLGELTLGESRTSDRVTSGTDTGLQIAADDPSTGPNAGFQVFSGVEDTSQQPLPRTSAPTAAMVWPTNSENERKSTSWKEAGPLASRSREPRPAARSRSTPFDVFAD